ncbi:MAG: TRAP transporter large permease subunit [Deltaproteobacteria bacterium]|nr:TRAP transporter large permease subunit [Deltaproteobacteria bacterium]
MSVPGAPTKELPRPVRIGHAVENGLVNLVFLVMGALPVIEILARLLIGRGIPGSASIVQHLTLWAAFLGAMLATREHRHLSLSTAEVLPAGKARMLASVFTDSVSAAVTALVAYAAWVMVKAESSDRVLVASIPFWWSEVVMPVGLIIMATRLVIGRDRSWLWRIVPLVAIGLGLGLGSFAEHAESFVWPLAILILLALLAGAPIYVAMSGLAMLFFFADETPIASVPTETLRLVVSPTLPAIPLLTAAGFILAEGGAARRLLRLYRALFGWMPGGLAIMACGVCAIFTAFTGGSGVTILALGGLVLPTLLEEKYPRGFSIGLVTASGSLGLLFPPSLPVILYGVVAQIPDFNRLFLAGLVPGVLMILLVLIYGVSVGIQQNIPRTQFEVSEAKAASWSAKWELGLPILIGFAILGGFATIVESAALALIYAVIVEVLIFRDIPLKALPATLAHGATLVGAVLIVLGMALGFTSYLVDASIPSLVIDWVKQHIESQWAFLLALNLLLLVIGSVVEIYAAIVILAPLVVPLGRSYGVDDIHLAIIFLANLELGFLFPPMGLNLFLSASRFNEPLPRLYRHALPFLGIMAVAVALITYFPALSVGVLSLLE